MVKDDFIKLISQPQQVSASHHEGLNRLLVQYPYLQSARALLLKGLKNKGSFKYNHELKTTAAHTTDRSMLFEFITSDAFSITKETSNLVEKGSDNSNIEVKETQPFVLKKVLENTSSSDTSALENELKIGSPLEFKPNETHSFAEWLKLSNFKPIDRTEVAEEKTQQDTDQKADTLEKKRALIDKFLSNNPKIVPKKTLKNNENLAKNNPKGDQELMTETLARIYLEQKNYKKAIQSYKILSLKYPEKNSFFADQIKKIKALEEYNK